MLSGPDCPNCACRLQDNPSLSIIGHLQALVGKSTPVKYFTSLLLVAILYNATNKNFKHMNKRPHPGHFIQTQLQHKTTSTQLNNSVKAFTLLHILMSMEFPLILCKSHYYLLIITHTENWFNSDTALAVCLVNIP